MSEKFKKVVQMFNDGEWEETLQQHFVTLENFLKIVKKSGLIKMIDPFSRELEEEQNELLHYMLQTSNKEEILNEIIRRYLSDITIENGKIMCDFQRMSDLSEFFGQSMRSYNYNTIVKNIFGEGDNGYDFYDTTDNVYRDVVEVLNSDNLNYFKNIILKKLDGVQIELDSSSSSWMEEESEKQGNKEYIMINSLNIDNVIKDEDTMDWLFGDGLEDIKADLYSVQNNAYQSAVESELYKNIVNELNSFFVWENKEEYKYGERYRFKIEVKPNVFENVIESYLLNNIGYHANLDYYGSFEGLLKENFKNGEGLLTFQVPEYADYTLTKKYINEFFKDYI
jgi:hypothetical protein